MNPEVDDFLEHHGIRGMRWGQRKQRQQNLVSQGKLTKQQVRKGRIKFARNAAIATAGAAAVGVLLSKFGNRILPSSGKQTIDMNSVMSEVNRQIYSSMRKGG